MRDIILGLSGAAAIIGFAMPAAAQDYRGHYREHRRFEAQYDDGHAWLDEEHAEAHEWGLTRREHRRLHRRLNREHAREDYWLRRQHRADDRRAYRRYDNGYSGYAQGWRGDDDWDDD